MDDLTKNDQPKTPKQPEKPTKKSWISLLLVLLLSGGMSLEVEVSDSHWRFAIVREPNSLVNLLDGFAE